MRCLTCPRTIAVDNTGRRLCRACEHRLTYVLRQLPAETELLRTELAPYRSPSTGTRFGGRAAPPLPLDVRVVDLLATHWVPGPGEEASGGIPIGPALVGWCSILAADYPYAERRDGTVYVGRGCEPVPRAQGGIPGWCRWLRLYLPFAVTRPWAAQMHTDLEDILHRVRGITRTQPRTRPRFAPCPKCGACAMSRTDGQWAVVCEACGTEMDPDDYAAHAAAVLPGLSIVMARLAAGEVEAVAS